MLSSPAAARRVSARLALPALPVAALVAVSGCSSDGPVVSTSSGTPAATAPAAGAALTSADFAAAIKRPGTVILDVRTPAEFAEGHLPGAVNMDVEAPTFQQRISTLTPGVPYAVYCRSGNRSAVALQEMAAAGLTAYHLEGGITEWTGAGGDVTGS